MASIAKRPNGQYRARYRDDTGKEHARHFPRKVDAQRWLDEVTASLVTGQYVDPGAGRMTLADYAKQWEATDAVDQRPSTVSITDNALRVHIIPALGDRPLASIRRSDVQAFVIALSTTHSRGTVGNVYGRLRRLFASAVDDRKLAESPCRNIKFPKAEGGEEDLAIPTPKEVARLIEQAPNRYRAAVVLLAGSGLRIGELLGLQVADIDFLRREVRVQRQRLQDGTLAEPKTAKSRRTIPLAGQVTDELAAHLARYPSDPWPFLTDAGNPVGYSTWRNVWRRTCRLAGLDLDTHDLRHFFASALIAGGASVKLVQERLGHSSPMVTLQTYTHLWPGDDDRTRSIMENALDGVLSLRTERGPATASGAEFAGQGT